MKLLANSKILSSKTLYSLFKNMYYITKTVPKIILIPYSYGKIKI